jgi:hypothetical protein
MIEGSGSGSRAGGPKTCGSGGSGSGFGSATLPRTMDPDPGGPKNIRIRICNTTRNDLIFRTILQPGSAPGQCWAFKGSHGTVVVRLSAEILVLALLNILLHQHSPTSTFSYINIFLHQHFFTGSHISTLFFIVCLLFRHHGIMESVLGCY